ncbi:T9SS type A sorting domain-containing protein [Hymenobacter tibetensis]|uniref:T9SS type A sorting domain-containing protein n=1 Tax=Hymenobacter tibetensis TaxID=497967 RepID=A0ABY4CWD8_9BACT|nr:T9SS type A sorting domain-containing protein [Hymenobacter tibetensis]UOG74082.1 T9SS type A sorting domain-containing protein [Hymenobacter tibetensis]
MKISTRLVGMLALLLAQLSALAATVTVEVGDNFYRPQNVVIRPGDIIRWTNVGNQSHPTVSDSSPALWSTFTISPANTSYTSQPFITLGSFNYYCSAHSGGTPRAGMIGNIMVSNTPQATLDAKAAGAALSVYPNPSRGLVVVTLNQKVGPEYKLRLTNILGREIRSFSLRTEASNTGMPLNLSDLPAGMYFYSLVLNERVLSTKRFVLQN